MATVNIDIPQGSGNLPATSVSPGVSINWTNSTNKVITSFHLPSCVSPRTSPAPIAVGATTRNYTVNNSASGSYTYTFNDGETLAPRNGTIDVG